jgi:glycosyltransferase involved in cell wall biosynthesis
MERTASRLLIAAFRHVADRNPAASLVIIGDGAERPRLEALCARLGLASQVRFLGAVGDHREALTHLKSPSVCVQPSTSEGGGSVAFHEANACGLPVVAFRHPQGIDPELIAEGVNGFWLDEIGAGALGRLLVDLLRDRPRLEALRRGSGAAEAALDWSRTVEAFDAALSRLADRSAHPEHLPRRCGPPAEAIAYG